MPTREFWSSSPIHFLQPIPPIQLRNVHLQFPSIQICNPCWFSSFPNKKREAHSLKLWKQNICVGGDRLTIHVFRTSLNTRPVGLKSPSEGWFFRLIIAITVNTMGGFCIFPYPWMLDFYCLWYFFVGKYFVSSHGSIMGYDSDMYCKTKMESLQLY